MTFALAGGMIPSFSTHLPKLTGVGDFQLWSLHFVWGERMNESVELPDFCQFSSRSHLLLQRYFDRGVARLGDPVVK